MFGGFPFGNMGGGGMGGGRPRKDVDTTALYKVLGVEKNASGSEIKKAYRKLAVKHHPDKGGDPDTFKEISKAYDILGDEEKRTQYDQFGEEGVGGAGGDGGDIFDMMFNGGRGGRRGGGGGQKKGKEEVHPLDVTLEDLYNGKVRTLSVTRQVIDRSVEVKTCQECDGQGVVIQMIRMGPMIQQTQQACSSCNGKGVTCKKKRVKEVLEVPVQKGAPTGHRVTFTEKSDEHPGITPGDVVFVLNEQPHGVFKRRGADLYIERSISLVEALCGFEMEIKHLDGRTLIVRSNPGDVITPVLYDPFAAESEDVEWEVRENTDCQLEDVARAETTDVDMLKQACSKGQLKGKGIGAFIVSKTGNTTFKQGTREECLAACKPKQGATMYILSDPDAAKGNRMMKCVVGEGMPTFRDQTEYGNLFLILNIQFPDTIAAEAIPTLRGLLPPPLNSVTAKEGEENVDVCTLETKDPVASYNYNKPVTQDEDEDEGHGMGSGGNVQCAQQ
jgi:DnaJ family protein A protein 2